MRRSTPAGRPTDRPGSQEVSTGRLEVKRRMESMAASAQGETAPAGADTAAIIFSSSLTCHLSTSEARLPPTHVGVRRVRPSSQAVKEAIKKRGLPALLAAHISTSTTQDNTYGSIVSESQDGGAINGAGPANRTFGSSVFTDDELMHPTKVSYMTTDDDGVERRMTKQEKKKKKSKLMKERLAMLKRLKEQQKEQKEDQDAVASRIELDAPVDDSNATGESKSGDDNYYAVKVSQTAIEEEVAELLGASNRVPPVVLSPPMVTEALRRDIICGASQNPSAGPILGSGNDDDITGIDQPLSLLWAITLQEAMDVAEEVRSQEDLRPMAYKIVPEMWHRLRPQSLLGDTPNMCSDDQKESKEENKDGDKSPMHNAKMSPEITEEEKKRWAFISTRSELPSFDEDIALVYKLLYRQTNLHVACGSKFGCDLLLYDGSREERHAFAGLRVCSCTVGDNSALDESVEVVNATDGSAVSLPLPSSYDLAGYVRCLNTAGKLALLATVVRSEGDTKPKVAIVDLALEKVLSAPTHKKKRRGKKRQQIRKDGSEHLDKKRG